MLLEDKDANADHTVDESYQLCLARWVMWSIETLDEQSDTRTDFDLRKEVTLNLMQALGHADSQPPESKKGYDHCLIDFTALTDESFQELSLFYEPFVLVIRT